ncbi:VWA domain-containing protein [Candidatus Dependentiae bacterium]|nr:VWA domain-containing protein [Candidatus Dependentiae bacterium]
MITFAYPWVLAIGFLSLIAWLFFAHLRKFAIVYRYSQPSTLAPHTQQLPAATKLLIVRSLFFATLVLLAARPQKIDEKSRVKVDGIDIILALDVSRSMIAIDDPRDPRSRIEIAKKEACSFINRRENDAIGLVIFAADALSLCPLTLDKKLLTELTSELLIGRVIDDTNTFIGSGLATAINRLRNSKAKSKVIVLITDGASAPTDPFDLNQAIEIANIFKIKVHTIGIGSSSEAYTKLPDGRIVRAAGDFQPDMRTLKKIADKTGGSCFEAKKTSELETIYKKIDELEKTNYETTLYARKDELFLWFAIPALLLFVIEFVLKILLWRMPI